MRGYAQQLLAEKGELLAIEFASEPATPWPTLEACVKAQLLSHVDLALAAALLKGLPYASQEMAALICHLSLCARRGHICISINDLGVSPHPKNLWCASDGEAPEEIAKIHVLLKDVESLIARGANESQHCAAIRRYNDLYYLQKYWVYEELFLEGLRRLLKSPPKQVVDTHSIGDAVAKMVADNKILPAQGKAITSVSMHGLTILTGGPGTGKTFTAGHMVKMLWQNLSEDIQGKYEIALAAPTGKAAANLQASLKRATEAVVGFPEIKASTLHGLLGIKGGKTKLDQDRKLSADLVLVDESSMIDISLMMQLIAAIKPGARLVLLGDRYQLPSVEAGSLFADLIRVFESLKLPSMVELTACMRAEKMELMEFAAAVNSGDAVTAINSLKQSSLEAPVSLLPFDPKNVQQQLLHFARPYFKYLTEGTPEEALARLGRFRVLTPLRQGPLGVEELNRLFDKGVKGAIVPIMLLQNDYRLELFNGETGVLVRDPSGDYGLFPGRAVGEPCRRIPTVLLPKFELAYCMSVHKSQGSEFDHVVMLAPKGTEFFGREVFYTAATRARQKLDVWGEEEILALTLANQSLRLSGISAKLNNL